MAARATDSYQASEIATDSDDGSAWLRTASAAQIRRKLLRVGDDNHDDSKRGCELWSKRRC